MQLGEVREGRASADEREEEDSVYTSHEVRSHPRRFIIPRSLTGVPTAWLRSARLVSSRPVPTVALVSTAISHVPRASSIPNTTRIKAEGGERGADGERRKS